MKPHLPPIAAIPATVFAAEPPDTSCPGTHLGVQRIGILGREHQLHRAFGHAFLRDERVVGLGEHVDDRIADRDDVIAGSGHEHSPVAGMEAATVRPALRL